MHAGQIIDAKGGDKENLNIRIIRELTEFHDVIELGGNLAAYTHSTKDTTTSPCF